MWQFISGAQASQKELWIFRWQGKVGLASTLQRLLTKVGESSVGNRTGKSQSIIGRAKPIDDQLYNQISVSHVKQYTTGPLKTTKHLNMYPVGLKQTARHVRS